MTSTIKIQLLRNLLDEVSTRYDYLYDINRQMLEETQYAASHDPLTGLVNRAVFEENLGSGLLIRGSIASTGSASTVKLRILKTFSRFVNKLRLTL